MTGRIPYSHLKMAAIIQGHIKNTRTLLLAITSNPKFVTDSFFYWATNIYGSTEGGLMGVIYSHST